jgi:hypothetical protein
MVKKVFGEFEESRNNLEQLTRKHIRGESLGVTERPD